LTPILHNRFLAAMHANKRVALGVKYKRIILKLSGEVLRGGGRHHAREHAITAQEAGTG
jgi:hypothetical protein